MDSVSSSGKLQRGDRTGQDKGNQRKQIRNTTKEFWIELLSNIPVLVPFLKIKAAQKYTK